MELAVIVALIAIAFGAALVQSTIGFGYSLLFAPLAALIVTPREAIAISLVTATILSVGLFWEHVPRASIRSIGPLVIAGIAGIPFGLLLLVHLSAIALHLLVGVGIIISAAVGMMRREHRDIPRDERLPLAVTAGLLSGVMRGSMSFPGPPVILYEHWVGGSAHDIRGRMFAYFLWTAIPGIALAAAGGVITTDVSWVSLACIPAIVAAVLCSRITKRFITFTLFQRLSMLLLILASLAAVAGAIAEWQRTM